MLRLTDNQPTLWESVLPPELFKMSEELAEVDKLLDDERFFAPFKKRFFTNMGRPTIPVATYLRLMYLKRRYELGYETLVKEVKDSFTWRRFCRLSLEGRVPDSTTLIKLSRKYGDDILRELNDALVLKLKEKKVIRGRKLRMDTTVTEANIRYPTDTGLLADGVKVITRTVAKAKEVVWSLRLFRKRLQAVATDRGFYSGTNERWLKECGVNQVSIPVRGKASMEKLTEQKQSWFRRLQRFRAGSEGRISVLKRKFGLRRSLLRGSNGTNICCSVGQGIFTHNLWQAARII